MKIGFLTTSVVILLLIAPAVSAATEEWTIGETYTCDEHTFKVTTLVPASIAPYTKISIDGAEDVRFTVGDNIIGMFTIRSIELDGIIVERIGTSSGQLPVLGDNERASYTTENTIRLLSGDVIQFSYGGVIMGALGYSPSEALHPTLLFWSGSRTPSTMAVPVPDEIITLTLGSSHEPFSIPGVRVGVYTKTATTVTLRIETQNYTISRIVSPLGQQDYTELIDRALQEALSKYGVTDENRIVVNVETGGISAGLQVLVGIVLVLVIILGVFIFIKWWYG